MFQRVVGPITCCLLLSWGVLAAPRKGDPPTVYYCASIVGDKSVYEMNDGGRTWESVDEVTEVRKNGAAVFVTFREAGGGERGPETYRMELSDKGVYNVAKGDVVHESPVCLLRLPFKKGETWETTDPTGDGDIYTTKHTSTEEEEIEVPAGKFRCVRTVEECTFKGTTWTSTHWTAPRYGTVKGVLEGKDYVLTSVLKSFVPGGK